MKKFTFLVMSTNGAPFRQISIPRPFICLILLVAAAAAGAIGYGGHDYINLKKSGIQNRDLSRTIQSRNEIIHHQRRQIQSLAAEINELKGSLIALNGFEQKIRVIANLEQGEDSPGLFGIGGSTPEDLLPNLDPEERHNGLIREMHDQINQLHQAVRTQENGFNTLIEKLEEQKNLLACTPAIQPAEGVYTSDFGRRVSPFTGLKEFHKGLDIAAPKGTPIIAPADGCVTFTGEKGGYGLILIIDHGYGLSTRYAHCSEVLKKPGDAIKRGEIIARMGNTGRSTGPHLHYEVRLNGMPMDPKHYILN
ncbi:MAG: metalloendopeptidase [Desulfococcus sp.]|nr:MAG: metalloendopeptidase [Desulfococcus sp.]